MSLFFKYYNQKNWEKFKISQVYLLKNSIDANDSVNIAKAYRFKANYFKRIEVRSISILSFLKIISLKLTLSVVPKGIVNILALSGILFTRG